MSQALLATIADASSDCYRHCAVGTATVGGNGGVAKVSGHLVTCDFADAHIAAHEICDDDWIVVADHDRVEGIVHDSDAHNMCNTGDWVVVADNDRVEGAVHDSGAALEVGDTRARTLHTSSHRLQ